MVKLNGADSIYGYAKGNDNLGNIVAFMVLAYYVSGVRGFALIQRSIMFSPPIKDCLIPSLAVAPGCELPILAKKINSLVEISEKQRANYVELGKLLLLARERVKISARAAFPDWCERFLVKKDGRPFSYKTIENYIYLASDPERVEKQKDMQRKNISRVRAKAAGLSTIDAVTKLFTKHTSTKDQCDILMCLWEQASEDAQEKFLKLIGTRL